MRAVKTCNGGSFAAKNVDYLNCFKNNVDRELYNINYLYDNFNFISI